MRFPEELLARSPNARRPRPRNPSLDLNQLLLGSGKGRIEEHNRGLTLKERLQRLPRVTSAEKHAARALAGSFRANKSQSLLTSTRRIARCVKLHSMVLNESGMSDL